MSTLDQTHPKSQPVRGLWVRLRPFTGLIALVILCGFFGSKQPRFLTPENFLNVLNAVAIVGILAVGQAFPLISGGFDLSQGAIACLSGAVVAKLMNQSGQPMAVAIAGGLAAGMLLGLVNGLLIAKVGINPFVATLGTQIAFFGLTNVYTNNQPLAFGKESELFRQLSFGQLQLGPFGLTYAAILFLGIVLLLAFVLRLLPYGQHIYTLGGNEEATRLAGIDTVRMKISVYVLSGLLAAVGGLVLAARAGQASPASGRDEGLQSLASCIVGGIALGGGLGGAWNVLLGAITLGAIENGLQMAVDAPNWRPVIQGLIILLAVAVDARARMRR